MQLSSRLYTSSSLHQFLPVSLNLFRSIRSLIVVVLSHLHSSPGLNPRRQPRWKPRLRRHDWKISLGYGRGMHSRSCWTCRGTSRRNFHRLLVDNGWYYDRWVRYTLVSDCFRIHIRQLGTLLPSDRRLYHCVGPTWSYVMVMKDWGWAWPHSLSLTTSFPARDGLSAVALTDRAPNR